MTVYQVEMPLCLSLAPTLRPVARESSLPWWRTSEEHNHETDIHPRIYIPCRHIHSRCCKKKVNWILRVGNLDSDFIFEVSKKVWSSVWQDHCDLLSRVSEGGLQEDNKEHHPGQQEHLQLSQMSAVLLRHSWLRRLHTL